MPQDHIEPQSAFEELAAITLADHSLDDVMTTVAQLTKRTVPGAAEVSVTIVDGGRVTTAAYTGALALHLDEGQYERGYGPCLDCIEGNAVVHVASTSTDARWPEYMVQAQPDFWSRTYQNWQSEFLAVGSMVVPSVYLRERGSPESKPVGAPHGDTSDTG